MRKIKIEFINQGFIDVLSSDGVKGLITEKAEGIKEQANSNAGYDDYKAYIVKGYKGTRWVGFVRNKNYRGYRLETENKTLSRAIK